MGSGGGETIPRHGRQHVSYGGQAAAAMGGEESRVEGQGAPGRPLSSLRGQRGAQGAGVGGGNGGGSPDAETGAGTGAETGTGAVDGGDSLLCPSAADWESVRMFGRSLRRRSRGAITNESRESVTVQAAAARPSSRPLSPSGSTDSHLSPATSPTATSPTSEGGPRGGRGRKGVQDGGGDVDVEAGGRVAGAAGAAGAVGEVTIAPGSTPPHSAFNSPPPPRDRDGMEEGVEGEIEGEVERSEESTGGGGMGLYDTGALKRAKMRARESAKLHRYDTGNKRSSSPPRAHGTPKTAQGTTQGTTQGAAQDDFAWKEEGESRVASPSRTTSLTSPTPPGAQGDAVSPSATSPTSQTSPTSPCSSSSSPLSSPATSSTATSPNDNDAEGATTEPTMSYLDLLLRGLKLQTLIVGYVRRRGGGVPTS
jgi:hypothetical protein